jgi:hypothetical protein
LFNLSNTLNFTIVDFGVTDHHIGVDRMHIDRAYKNLVKNSIVHYFEYLSSIIPSPPIQPIGRSSEAKARRNQRRHDKLSVKQHQYYLIRKIDSLWSFDSVKKYLHEQHIKFAKIPPIHRKRLRIQFNNPIDLQTAEATLPPNAFSQ